MPEIVETFQAVLADHTAGSPVAEEVIWTDRTARAIAEQLAAAGTLVSVHIVDQLLEAQDYHRRKAQKNLPLDAHPDRDAQFRNIARLKEEFWHDFPSYAEGVVMPHGLYDLRRNRGYLHLGTSHETSAFACDCLADWWCRFGQVDYPEATTLLLFCDGGGSNSATTYLFKADLQAVVNQFGLEVRVAHYPPYCSKYNPIEHRLFCHVTRACQGVLFTRVELVKQLMEKTRTRTGLRVVVDVVDKLYATGRKVAAAVKKALHLVRDTLLPKWNYRLLPQG